MQAMSSLSVAPGAPGPCPTTYLALSAPIRPRGLARSCMGAGVRPNWGTLPSGRPCPGRCARTRPCQPWAGICGRCSGWTMSAPNCCGTTGGGLGRSNWPAPTASAACSRAWRRSAPRHRPLRPGGWRTRLTTWACWCCMAWSMRAIFWKCSASWGSTWPAWAPRRGPWRDVSGHLYRMGATALPITALVGFLIGVVLAYLMSLQLRQFGAESFIVNILGISLIRELGPMLAAILVAGRSGSAITAQIGVMRVTEELDAMRVMGIAHGFRLVLPRTLALALAMPLLSLWTTLAALAGGMLAADLTMGISPAYFAQALPAAVRPGNLGLAMAKSVVFGAGIALMGCQWGLRVRPDTQSLGEGTTASVVSAITMVIVVDALFAVTFKTIGI